MHFVACPLRLPARIGVPSPWTLLVEAQMSYEIEVREIKDRRHGLGRFAVAASMFFVLVLLFRQIL